MNKIGLLLTLVLLLSATICAQKTFVSKEAKVGFKYPSSWTMAPVADLIVDEPGFSPLVRVVMPDDLYPNTTYHGGQATLAVASISEAECKKLPDYEGSDERTQISPVKLGTQTFNRIAGYVGEMGSKTEGQLYRVFHDGRCFQFELQVHRDMAGAFVVKPKEVNVPLVFKALETTLSSMYFVAK